MKYILSLISLICLVSVEIHAGHLELKEGSLDSIKGQTYVSVEVDYAKAVYKEKGGLKFDDFLRKHRRMPNWEQKCLDYFCEWFNDETMKTTACVGCKDAKYAIVVVVKEISSGGKITGNIVIKQIATGKQMALLTFKGSDGDVEDMIPLRDPMKDAGESLGKFLNKNL